MNITTAQVWRFAKMQPSELEQSLKSLSNGQINATIQKCKEIIQDSQINDPSQEGIWKVMDLASWMEVQERLAHSIIND